MNFKSIFEISENKNSLGNQFREKRFSFFLKKINKLPKPVSVLDVGGKINFWENRGLAGNLNYTITIVNFEKEKSQYSNIKTLIGDATDLSQFVDKSFDIVHSNSVIEHLYNFNNQSKMASEIVRVGKKYIVQTPNKCFFLEPHYLLPFFQFIPDKLKYLILTKTKLSRLKKWDKNFAKQYINEIRLLSLKEMKILFPKSKIYFEKFFGMNKSFTAHNF
ncbi:class I SAM-dependent methyltransferase [Flavobacteriaceae bacterium]|nr:class I SAM-dependent methyltransferase [Flavobacteriaceae bacterium]